MKILIFRTASVPINIKSYNVQELGLAKSLIKLGNQCDIILYTDKEERIEYIDTENGKIKIYWLKAKNILHHGIYDWKKIKKIANEYDVIHCNDYNQYATYYCLKNINKPIVIYHGPYKSKFPWKTNLVDKVFDLMFLRKIRKMNPYIITKSKLAEQTLINKGFTNVHTISVGLDIERFIEIKIKLESRKNQLLYIGQISKRRNIMFILAVLSSLVTKNPDTKLVIIGKGKKRYEDKVNRFISKNNLTNNVEWIKKLPQEDLVKYYLSSKVFIFPSNYEIFGMVLLEANFFNLPIVSSRNGGSISIIDNDNIGKVLDDFNKEEWTNAIEYYLNNEIEQGMFTHSWDNIAQKFIDSYHNVR